MATKLSVNCGGKRYPVKIGPMQPLKCIIEQVASKQKPAPTLADCILLVNGKSADLNVPFRLANFPSNAKIDVIAELPQRLGIRDTAATQSAAVNQSNGVFQKAPANPGAAATSSSSAFPAPQYAASLPSAAAQPHSQSAQRPLSQHLQGIHQEQQTPKKGTLPSIPEPHNASASVIHRELNSEVLVFTRGDLENLSTSGRDEEVPDEFYEFGVEDYAKVVQGYKIAKQRAEAGLRTAKMRETEAVERAKRFPETRIRIFFPDGFVVQMKFASLDPVAIVKQAVGGCLRPEVASSNWYLYITPPKQVLTEEAASLYSAGLCPAARLYFGCQREHAAFLKAEVASLRAAVPAAAASTDESASAARGSTSRSNVASDTKPSMAGQKMLEGGKLPKWLKKPK